MKKLFIALMLCMVSIVGFGQSDAYVDNLTWTLDTESGILIISGTGSMTNYTYSKINGKPNTPWYFYYESIKTVIIKDGVTSIGDYAFSSCSSLTSIEIPTSVTSIRSSAFSSCSSLISVTIGNNVTSIGDGAFSGCTGLTSIMIPNSVTSIGDNAFYNCTDLTSVHISDIAAWCKIAFSNFTSNPLYYAHNLYLNGTLITDLDIPDDITSIGDYAFNNCNRLSSVTFESPNPSSIGTDCFAGCSCTFYVLCGAKETYAAALNVEESRVKTYKPKQFIGGKKSSFSVYNNDNIQIGKSAFPDAEDWCYLNKNKNKFWVIKAQTNSNAVQYNYIQLYFWVDTDTELYTYGDGYQGVKPGTYSFQTPRAVQHNINYTTHYSWDVNDQYYNNCAIGLCRDSYWGVCPVSSWAAENYYNGFDVGVNPVVSMNNATIVVKEGKDGHIYIEIWITKEGNQPELYITINEPKHDGVETYKLTVNHTGNGSVDFSVDECGYEVGEQINITIIPDDGWILSGWVGNCTDCIVSNKDGTYTITMIAMDCEVTAVFRQISNNITLQENKTTDYYTQFPNVNITNNSIYIQSNGKCYDMLGREIH